MAKRKSTSTRKRSTPRTKVSKAKRKSQNKVVFGSFLLILSAAMIISFVSFYETWKTDQSELANWPMRETGTQNVLSTFGAELGNFFIYRGLGLSSFIFPLLLAFSGLLLFFDRPLRRLLSRWVNGIMIAIWASIAAGFFNSRNELWGGKIGYEINDFLSDYTGKIGVILLLTFLAILGLTRWFHLKPGTYYDALGKGFSGLSSRLIQTRDSLQAWFTEQVEKLREMREIDTSATEEGAVKEAQGAKWSQAGSIEQTHEEIELFPKVSESYTHKKDIPPLNPEEDREQERPAGSSLPAEADSISFEVEDTSVQEDEVEQRARKLVEEYGEFDPRLELGTYQFPSVELLDLHGGGNKSVAISKQELEENKDRIVETLNNYKIGISQIKATIGPTVTLYEIVPEAGVRISKIKNLEDDIALSLAALGIRIIAPIPGKGTIGIEVPNTNPSIVSMKTLITSARFVGSTMELPIAFGKTISNETFVVDLAKMPHLLMAGATGQGKSVGLNAVITSLLYKKHPSEIKFVLVDPKKVELTLYNKIERHFLAKLPDSEDAIITDTHKVVNTLNSLCVEMDNRYELLKTAMVRNIKEYNTKFVARKLNPNEGHRYLPYVILIIDEFADLIMTAGKEIETPIARLTQLARAIGIHLIIATQRPSVNVITGIIKANFPARLAFRVTSKIDSRTILDVQGAEQLIGRGDMLFTQGNDLTRLQCAFVDTPEVARITDFIGSQRGYPEAHLLPEVEDDYSGTGVDNDPADRDSKFREAAEVVVSAQQGSASLIQRKLKLGYNRAGRIIDQLEAAGIVGPFEGSKARQVLIPDLIALEQYLDNETH